MLMVLRSVDLAVVGAAIGLLFLIAWLTGRKESDTRDFFLGRRKIPALVVCLSFVATEISALTIISVPAQAFNENWRYLQFFIGSAVARVFVAFLFIPAFYKQNCTSIYEYLRDRFGRQTQYTGAIFFFITRLVASGIRLYVACMAIAAILGWGLLQTLLLFTLISIAFIALGGVKAVVWSGAYQAVIFFAAGAALIWFLLGEVEGGLGAAWHSAEAAGRLSIFDFRLDFNNATTFWAGTANAFFVGLAVFGTDQELVQRLLTVETRGKSQQAIIGTIAAALPLLCLYLGIGTLLFVLYQQQPQLPRAEDPNKIFPFFAAQYLPMGLRGLFLAAVVLASIDSPLSSLASSFVTDIYRPLCVKTATEKHYLIVSRGAVVAFGLLLLLIARLCVYVDNLLWFAFQIVSITGGATLGIFLFGVLTRRKAAWGNVAAMLSSALLIGALLILGKRRPDLMPLAWSWLIVIGTALTFGLSYLFSLFPSRPRDKKMGKLPAQARQEIGQACTGLDFRTSYN